MRVSICITYLLLINILFGTVPDQLIFNIRNPKTPPSKFRDSLQSIGEYLALDVLAALPKKEVSVTTMTGENSTHFLPDEIPILVTILRAGLPLHIGIQKIFSDSEVGFFAISRNEETLESKIEYISLPNLKDRYVILSDTMLATGGSILNAIGAIQNYNPKKIFLITALASRPGLDRLLEEYPEIAIFTGTIDPNVNDRGYIVPGLGDAGDRSYGEKYITTEIISQR